MLSKIALLILGLIAEKSINPYEIKKLMVKLDMEKILPMSSSTIYATINGLVKKKYIKGKKTKDGKMPEKTIYSITKAGDEAFKTSLKNYLTEPEKILSEFDMSISLICHLDKAIALESLKNHRVEIEAEISERKKMVRALKKNCAVPYTGLTRRMHYIYKREAELKTINNLIIEIEKDNEWNYFIVDWFRSEVVDSILEMNTK